LLSGNWCDAVLEFERDSGGDISPPFEGFRPIEARFWGMLVLPFGLIGVAGFSKDSWGRSGDLAGGALGKGSKASKAPKDWIESPLGLGMKLRGRRLRRFDSVSLSPPYMSPMASVTWWLSSLMDICGACPRRGGFRI
jgi:hypothetical protein